MPINRPRSKPIYSITEFDKEPNPVGIGLRYPHLVQFSEQQSVSIGWVEVHSENFYSLGGPDFEYLYKIRERYPVSLHGIGMSLGSVNGIDDGHIALVKGLIDIIDPFLISDHLSWNTVSNKFLPDLLPTPFNKESLDIFADNISFVQDKLQRKILLENPSTYFEYINSTYSEPEFLNTLMQKTGAGILLDVNNVYISGLNNGWSPRDYIDAINPPFVGEMHVSGHSQKKILDNESLYIDSHDNLVCDEVWQLFEFALKKFGILPTMVEWDINIPALEVLLDEAAKIDYYMTQAQEKKTYA
ncbi:DUF692 domain-containing protein [Candidatus Megaera venefica]|uniref:DUF692 domain-containing protein n=1 Tax=Candidatus Megaera venefica TaxID=2055910 RepID=A0ABU5NAK7_9RICK|nr:DUF692 domain-containing protein [Candidatus Megaera venefica]MEA0970204.1 DUF692 domain-containing protein [Candidatus Megaera venefica]